MESRLTTAPITKKEKEKPKKKKIVHENQENVTAFNSAPTFEIAILFIYEFTLSMHSETRLIRLTKEQLKHWVAGRKLGTEHLLEP